MMSRLALLIPVLLPVLSSSLACSSSDEQPESSDDALELDPMKTLVVSGTIEAPQGTNVRLLKLASESVFSPDDARAKSLPICRTGPGFPSHDPEEQKDPRLAYFNRAKVRGASFSIEIPENPGAVITATCKYRRSQDTVLKFTALTDDGVRLKFDVPVQFRSDVAAHTATIDVVDGHASGPVVVSDQETRLAIRLPTRPTEPVSLAGMGEFSFAEMAEKIRVDAATSPASFPTDVGASDAEISAAILTNSATIDKRSLRLRRDQSRILVHDGEEKPTEGIKAFHPFGACSTAKWRITQPTPFSGLFATNTEVDALIRFSAGGNNETTHADLGLVHRLVGFAVKLFPGARPTTKTESQNIVVFDEFGPHGNPSPWFFKKEDGQPTFFANWVFGNDPITHGNVNMFTRSVSEPRTISLTALATVRADGTFEKASAIRAPKFIKFVPNIRREVARQDTARKELDEYADGDIELAVHLLDESARDGDAIPSYSNQVGVLTAVSKPLVSPYCDRKIQFHHAPQ
jgi:hypothetical protein